MTRRLTSSTSAVCLVMAALVLTVAASAPAAPILPPLKFARAVTEVHRGRCEAVLDDLHALSEEAGPTGGRASYLLAHCLLKRGDIDAARSAFDRVAEHFPPLADHARLYAAEAGMQSGENAGDRTLAVRAYSMAWWSVPDAPGADAAYQRLLGLQPERLPVPPADARLQRAGRLAAAGEFAAAEGELTDALHQSLPPDVAADAWFRLGILRLRSRGAAYAFEQSASIPGPHRPRALYWFGRALANDDRDGE